MTSIKVSFEFGLLIRKRALLERDVSLSQVLQALETDNPLDENDNLLSFGPSFGREALDMFADRLRKLGLVYFDDFVDLDGYFPDWFQLNCEYKASG